MATEDMCDYDLFLWAFQKYREEKARLHSERTKAGMAAAKERGVKIGPPCGLRPHACDAHREKILTSLVKASESKSALAERLGVSRASMLNYIKTRGLEEEAEKLRAAGSGKKTSQCARHLEDIRASVLAGEETRAALARRLGVHYASLGKFIRSRGLCADADTKQKTSGR